MPTHILTINGGSSSIKFALFGADAALVRVLAGKIERIGLANTAFSFNDFVSATAFRCDLGTLDFSAAGKYLIEFIDRRVGLGSIGALGYRVVHGGAKFSEPQRITDDVLAELKRISPYDPEHMPAEIALIELFRRHAPTIPQIACFDTAFHRSMPRVARILPIPRKYEAMGIQRYGFHGISYAYLMEELARVVGKKAARGRVILAHLGNGASLAAVRHGKSMDTSMGFTPTGGLPMGTRTGDLDPGVAWYMIRYGNLSPKQFNNLINRQSGLRGISET